MFYKIYTLIILLHFSLNLSASDTKNLQLGIGIFSATGNHYRGSDQYKNWSYPVPYFSYSSEKIEAENTFVRGTILENDFFSTKFSFLLGLNVENEKNRARESMPSLGHSFEIGPLFIFKLKKFETYSTEITLELPIRQAYATNFSYLKNFGFFTIPYLNIVTQPSSWNHHWKIELSFGPMFASSKYHQHFYDVEHIYSKFNRPTFVSVGGYSGFQSALILHKKISNVILLPFLRWDFLEKAKFINSPLVRTKNYIIGGFGIFWLL